MAGHSLTWKDDWGQAKARFIRWWERKGLVVSVQAPARVRLEEIAWPEPPADMERRWTDPPYRCRAAEHRMAGTFFGGEAFPYFDTQIGPGSLGTFLGGQPEFSERTVWYRPCISDPDRCGPIRFDVSNKWFQTHVAVVDEGLRRSQGRYLVGMPDLIENLDTLAALRGSEEILLDLIERPAWVSQRLCEINEAYFAAFALLFERIRDGDGGNAFSAFGIWGPGKTGKTQCDISCMISPPMFRRFVVPCLRAQCQWLDYSLYHLDGTTALQHLEALLEIGPLDAIQWTPQPGLPGGGSPHWYDLYRRIRAGGKGVQAIGVNCEEIIPLIEAVGPEGLFIRASAGDQGAAEAMLVRLEQYYR